MEKYGQYRDKGSGIAPFFPIPSPASSPLLFPYHVFLFFFRIPFLLLAWSVWLFFVQWAPAGSLLRKANLWCILGIPGVWWIDIRVDGVHRGSLGRSGSSHLPAPGTIIAASYTSPLDILYLAAIFDPVFTQSYPGSRLVRPLSFEGAVASCFNLSSATPSDAVKLSEVLAQHPHRVIVVFPESTTSNGRGILRLSTSLLSAPKDTSIYPVALRYTPADVVTPIPGWTEAMKFLWKLCSRQTHCIRVRVGLPITMTSAATSTVKDATRGHVMQSGRNGFDTNFFDSLQSSAFGKTGETGVNGDSGAPSTLSPSEQSSLDAIAESLSRLGRAKTLGLGMEEKVNFVDAWAGKSKKRR